MKMITMKEFTSSIINSFLGPNKSNKMVMEDKEIFICRCALQLFEKTLLQDPLSSLVEETLLAHHSLYGCSTLSLLAMWHLWSGEFRLAVDEGYEIQDIVMNAQNVLESVIASLSKISVSIESMIMAKKLDDSSVTTKNKSSVANQVPTAIRYSSRHFSPSAVTILNLDNLDENYQEIDHQCLSIVQDLDHDDDSEVATLVSECWKMQRSATKCIKFKTDVLLVCPITLPSSNSSVLEGLILKSNFNPSSYQLVKNADTNRALIINGSVTFEHIHLGFSPKVSVSVQKTAAEILVSAKEIWLEKCCKLILQLQIDILLIKDDVDPEVANFCSTQSVLVFSRLPWSTLKILCDSCQYSPCTYILDCDEKCILKNVKVGNWKQEEALLTDQYVILNVNLNMMPPLQSIVLCHPSPTVLKMKKHQLHHLLSRLSSVVQSGKLLPGGGETETHCYAFLKQSLQFQNPADPKAKVTTAIAKGYQNYSKIISKKLELFKHHNEVHDDVSSKISSWHSAMALALLTLQCDSSIINGIEDCS